MNASDVIKKIKRVTIELSNQCPMAPFHKQCPAHKQTEVRILPMWMLDDIFETLLSSGQFNDKKKTIAFHCYNEPTSDPRLFMLMRDVRRHFSQVGIRICSNGEYMTPALFRELIEEGATRIVFSAYSDERYEALKAIVAQPHTASVRVHRVRKLDGRDTSWVTESQLDEPCGAPFSDIMIRSTGNVGLCCYDCDESVVFGNLHTNNLADVLVKSYEKMATFREALQAGDRSIAAVCQHCQSKR